MEELANVQESENTPTTETPETQSNAEISESESIEPEKAIESDEEIEYDGEKYKVPPKLKDAFLRQQDYTRKTQEVAAHRKEFEQQQAAFKQQAEAHQKYIIDYAEAIAIEKQLEQYKQVDWSKLIEADPVEALKLDHQVRALQERRNQALAIVAQKQQREALETQQSLAKRLQEGRAELQRDINGWTEETARKVAEYGISIGYTPQEVSSITDPKIVKMLHKGWLYDQLQKQAAAPKPEVQEKPVTRIDATKAEAKNPANMSDKEFAAWRRKQINARY